MTAFFGTGQAIFRKGRRTVAEYEDTLRRLLRGTFEDLSEAERRERTEQIIRASALAAMALGATPVPLLEMPVLAAMVRAIAKVHGVEQGGAKGLIQLGASLGGGIFLRQVMRLIPFAGPLPHLSRIYGATYALGRTAQIYFARGAPLREEELRREFEATLAAKTEEQASRMKAGRFEARLEELRRLRAKGLLSEEEYREKRGALLALL